LNSHIMFDSDSDPDPDPDFDFMAQRGIGSYSYSFSIIRFLVSGIRFQVANTKAPVSIPHSPKANHSASFAVSAVQSLLPYFRAKPELCVTL
jgi:hypothetical protein